MAAPRCLDSAADTQLSAPHRRAGLEEDQPRHLRLDDSGHRRRRAGPAGTLHQRAHILKVLNPLFLDDLRARLEAKQMREIKVTINQRRHEQDRRSDIPITNFRGIKLRDFAAEIARLALSIAEYQCDVKYRGQQGALAEFLPLSKEKQRAQAELGEHLSTHWHRRQMAADDLFKTPLKPGEEGAATNGHPH